MTAIRTPFFPRLPLARVVFSLLVTVLLGAAAFGKAGGDALPFTHVLSDGTRIEVVAVTDSKFERCWKPDGKPIKASTIRALLANEVIQPGVAVLLRITLSHPLADAESAPSVMASFGPSGMTVPANHPRVLECVCYILPPKGARKTSVDLTASLGAWKVTSTCTYRHLRRVSGTFFGDRIHVYRVPGFSMPIRTVEHGKSKVTVSDAGFWVDYQHVMSYHAANIEIAAYDEFGNLFPPGAGDVTFKAQFRGDGMRVVKVQQKMRPSVHFAFGNVVISR